MDLELVKNMDNTPPKRDSRKAFGNKCPNANARTVTEETRNEVITPQVNDRSPKSFAHGLTKRKEFFRPTTGRPC